MQDKTGKLTETEATVIKLKYSGPRLETYSDIQLMAMMPDLLIKVNALTGWNVPDGPVLKVLLPELVIKIRESWNDLTVDEFIYAFRTYGKTVENFGKKINIAIMDNVITEYKAERFELSQMEERVKALPPEDPQKLLEAMPVTLDQEIRAYYTLWDKAGRKYQYIPMSAYKVMESTLNLSIEEKKRIFAYIGTRTPAQGEEKKRAAERWAVHEYFLNKYKQ